LKRAPNLKDGANGLSSSPKVASSAALPKSAWQAGF
jgi:hypothetical protein